MTYEKLRDLAKIEPSVLTEGEIERLKRGNAIPQAQRNILKNVRYSLDDLILLAEHIHDLISDYLEGEYVEEFEVDNNGTV